MPMTRLRLFFPTALLGGLAVLAACQESPESDTAPTFGDTVNGQPVPEITDAYGTRWSHLGSWRDLPPILPAESARPGEALRLDSPMHPAEDQGKSDSEASQALLWSTGGYATDLNLVYTRDDATQDWQVYAGHLDQDTLDSLAAAYIAENGNDAEVETPVQNQRIVGDDDRTRVEFETDAADPYEVNPIVDDDRSLTAIRRIFTRATHLPDNGVGVCTGVMLSYWQDGVQHSMGITAAHCLVGQGNGVPTEVHVCPANTDWDNGDSCPEIAQYWVNVEWEDHSWYRNDWAVFSLNANPDGIGSHGFLLDITDNEDRFPNVEHVGIPGEDEIFHQFCLVTGEGNHRLSYDCDTEAGHSGGPVFKSFSNGSHRLVAVHSGAYYPNNRGAKVVSWLGEINAALQFLATGQGRVIP